MAVLSALTSSCSAGTAAHVSRPDAGAGVHGSTPSSADGAQQRKVTATVLAQRLPQPVAREVLVPMPAGAEVAGGLVAGDVSTAAAYQFDPANGAVSHRSQLAVPVHDAAGAPTGGSALVLGGGNATEQATVQRLASSGRWRVMGHLPQPRSDLSVVVTGGRIVVLGGYDGVTSPATVLASRGGRHFRTVTKLPVSVRYAAVVVYRRAIWLFGGEHNGHAVSVVQRVSSRNWRAGVVGHLPRPLSDAAAVVMHGTIVFAGGRDGTGALTRRICIWDVARRSCIAAGRLPYPLADTGVLPEQDAAYLLGGETPALTDRVIRLTLH